MILFVALHSPFIITFKLRFITPIVLEETALLSPFIITFKQELIFDL